KRDCGPVRRGLSTGWRITLGRRCRGYLAIFWYVPLTPRNGVALGLVRLVAVRFLLGPGSDGLPVAVELPIHATTPSSRGKYPGQIPLRSAGQRWWGRYSDRRPELVRPSRPHRPPRKIPVRLGPAAGARPATTIRRPAKCIRPL